jgi:hypothetical protein
MAPGQAVDFAWMLTPTMTKDTGYRGGLIGLGMRLEVVGMMGKEKIGLV